MKRHIQELGVRRWHGDDLLELQSEPLRVIDDFFGQYNNHIVSGCEFVSAAGKHHLLPGLVLLAGKDPDGENVRLVVPFAGATDVTLPVFLSLNHTIHEETYVSGVVKPVTVEYFAELSTSIPADPSIKIAEGAANRFVDVIQNEWQMFVTEIEKEEWSGKQDALTDDSITTEYIADYSITPQKLDNPIRYIPCFITLTPEESGNNSFVPSSVSFFDFIAKNTSPGVNYGVTYYYGDSGGTWQVYLNPELASRLLPGSIQVSLAGWPTELFLSAKFHTDAGSTAITVSSKALEGIEFTPETFPNSVNLSFLIKG